MLCIPEYADTLVPSINVLLLLPGPQVPARSVTLGWTQGRSVYPLSTVEPVRPFSEQPNVASRHWTVRGGSNGHRLEDPSSCRWPKADPYENSPDGAAEHTLWVAHRHGRTSALTQPLGQVSLCSHYLRHSPPAL